MKPGNVKPDDVDFYNAACDELRLHAWPEVFMPIAESLVRWRQSKNPFYVDMAALACSASGIPLTPIVQSEIAEAARMRMLGTAKGTAAAVHKEQAQSFALVLIANLVHAGLSVDKAARKAAGFPHMAEHYSAATLDRYYCDNVRKLGMQKRLFASWDRSIPDHAALWESLIEAMPDAPIPASGGGRR